MQSFIQPCIYVGADPTTLTHFNLSGYLFDFYNEISQRVIQDVTKDGGSVLQSVLRLVGKNPYGRDFSDFVGSRESLREKSPLCRDL